MKVKLSYNHWQIAYRLSKDEEFHLIPNPEWAWAADPFLVKFYNEIYLFAELFLYKSERNGVIGYCKYQNGKFGKWFISMDEHWHLSYPNVFTKDNKLYMCPESYQKNEIGIYELEKLPNKWKLVDILLPNIKCVDTTFLSYKDENYFFTFCPTFQGNNGTLLLYKYEKNKSLSEPLVITDKLGSARPGGNILKINDRLIRVSQNNLSGYGYGLVFNEIDSLWPDYKEHMIKEIIPKDIKLDTNKDIIGVHTYNKLDDLEVIDIKFKQWSLKEYFAVKRVRKVFLNKYN